MTGRNTWIFFSFILFYALLLPAFGATRVSEQGLVPLMEMIEHPERYHGQTIRVKGDYGQATLCLMDGEKLLCTYIDFVEKVKGPAKKLFHLDNESKITKVIYEGVLYGPVPLNSPSGLPPDIKARLKDLRKTSLSVSWKISRALADNSGASQTIQRKVQVSSSSFILFFPEKCGTILRAEAHRNQGVEIVPYPGPGLLVFFVWTGREREAKKLR
jgi:hypothetical protein